MSVLPVWIPAWIPACLDPCGTKRTSRPRPGACDTSLEPSWQKKSIHEKKIPLRARVRPQCTETCSFYYISHLKRLFRASDH